MKCLIPCPQKPVIAFPFLKYISVCVNVRLYELSHKFPFLPEQMRYCIHYSMFFNCMICPGDLFISGHRECLKYQHNIPFSDCHYDLLNI